MTHGKILITFAHVCQEKKNRIGTITVVVVLKINGKFKEIHNHGTVKTTMEVDALMLEVKKWISSKRGK